MGLFGMFNHVIPMRMENRITIIHGPNGFGKTTLLKLIDAIFNDRFLTINKIRFTEFKIEFDNGSSLLFTSKIKLERVLDKKKPIKILEFNFSEPSGSVSGSISPTVSDYLDQSSEFPSEKSALYRYLSKLPKYSFERVYRIEKALRSGIARDELDFLSKKDLESLPFEKSEIKAIKAWNQVKEALLPVHFIQSQRLLTIQARPLTDEPQPPYKHSVVVYSKELAKKIESKLAESAALSQKLDRTFPSRLVEMLTKQDQNQIPSQEEISERLEGLEKKSSRLMEAGLLDREKEAFLPPKRELMEHTLRVLDLNIKDTEIKLAVFDEFVNKLELMKEIINKRFLYKEMTINRKKGFVFNTATRKPPLKLETLSSGEQHEVVLMYELLFRTKPGSLILIDEPEISLHVAWQHEFLRDLQKIAEIADLDILIATHSPQVIHDRWDLTVKLEGPPL